MGWRLRWLSSYTHSTYGRRDEMVGTAYMYLDLTPKGRHEAGPHYNLGDWGRHHDGYCAEQPSHSARAGAKWSPSRAASLPLSSAC